MNRRFSILILLALSLGIYVATAAQPALLDDADASHALVSREMLQRGDWVVMYQDGIRYLEKAPLHYWMVAVSYKLFGQGAFQTRLPLVLSVVGLVLMVYFLARRWFGETAAFYSGLVICTSVGTWLFTRVMVPEAIFALELTALFYLFLRAWNGTLSPRVGYWGASVVMALAALTLGLIGVLFPLGVIFFFILFTSGSRMEYYSFGAWPAIAVLLAVGLADAEEARDRWLPRLQAGLAVVGLLTTVVLGYLVLDSLDVSSKGGISHLLQYHDLDTYRLSMAHIFDLTPQTFAALRGPAIFAMLLFIVGFGRAWSLRRRWKNSAATLTLALGMGLFFFAANWAFKRFEPRMSSRALADSILPYLRPQDQVVQYGDFNSGSSIPFYTHRHVWIYNGRFGTNLEIGSNYPDVPPTFLDDQQFPAFWSSPNRVFIFVPEEFRKDALSHLPPDSTYLLAESAGKYIFVNQPLRPNLPLLASMLAQHQMD